jgi:Predicted transcriptional regulators
MDVKVAAKLYDLRRKKGMSQEELADALGVTRQAVSKWERAESSPDTDNLIALAKLYGVSLDELIGFEEIKGDPERPEKTEKEENPSSKTDKKTDKKVSFENGKIRVESDDGNVEISGVPPFIHITDTAERQEVHIPPFIHIDSNKGKHIEIHKTPKTIWNSWPAFLIILTAYLVMGSVRGLWHPGWLVFFLVPIYYGLVDAIYKKDANSFPVPVLAAGAYLMMGFLGGAEYWRYGWIVFMSVPIYYSIIYGVNKYRKSKLTIITEDKPDGDDKTIQQ